MRPRCFTAETLNGYKLLIILRDGMNWPDGISRREHQRRLGCHRPSQAGVRSPVPPRAIPSRNSDETEQVKLCAISLEKGGSALFLHNVTTSG